MKIVSLVFYYIFFKHQNLQLLCKFIYSFTFHYFKIIFNVFCWLINVFKLAFDLLCLRFIVFFYFLFWLLSKSLQILLLFLIILVIEKIFCDCLSKGRSIALAHRIPMNYSALPELFTCPNGEVLLLTCHGSVIYLHVLASIFPLVHPHLSMTRSNGNILNSQYRVQSFIDYILRPSRLAPASARLIYSVLPKERGWFYLFIYYCCCCCGFS